MRPRGILAGPLTLTLAGIALLLIGYRDPVLNGLDLIGFLTGSMGILWLASRVVRW